MRRALVVGIDDYPNSPLSGCVNDANAFAECISKNEDGSPNFSVIKLVSSEAVITTTLFRSHLNRLFEGDADSVILYFAGHGIINENTNSGYLVTQNGDSGSWGISISDVVTLANRSYPKIKSCIIFLDSCGSGYAGQGQPLLNENLSIIGTGVTIITACERSGVASEWGGHGVFTGLILESLRGAAADICGYITPSSIYSIVDQSLGAWEQRPLYKANVKNFFSIREVAPKIPLEIIRNLPKYFEKEDGEYNLDPSYEPDRNNVPVEYRSIPKNPFKEKIFGELQMFNRQGLVVPVGAQHMYYAAIESKSCTLTPLGKHYRKLVIEGKLK